MAENQYYYNTAEYKERLEELKEQTAELRAEREEEAKQKEQEIKIEIKRLKKIFTADRCGSENMHFVIALIDRAAFLKVELEHMENKLRTDGVLDFFTLGLQTMWREHPLSKVHVQYVKNYKEIITKLESYGQASSSTSKTENPVFEFLGKANTAREKYSK